MNINGSLNITSVASGSSATEILVYNSGNIERRSTLPQASIVNLTTDLANKQPLSTRLTAWDGLNVTGIIVQTSTTTWVSRTITGPAAGITITNGNGVSGNPTLVLANDLAALEGLGSTGIAVRTATDTWAQRTMTGTTNQIVVTNGNGVSGNPTFALDSTFVTNNSLWRPGSTGTNNIRDQFGFSDATGNDSICFGGNTGLGNNIASGNNSGVISGRNNIASGLRSFGAGGENNTISGINSFAAGGANNVILPPNALVSGANHSPTVNANSSISYGVQTSATTFGERVSGIGALSGFNAQEGTICLSLVTTTSGNLSLTNGTGNTGIVIPNNTAWIMTIRVQGTITSATNRGNTRTFEAKIRVKNTAGTMSAVLIGNLYTDGGETGTTAFTNNFTTLTTGKWLPLIGGAASTTVSWLAVIDYTKIQFL